MVIKSSSYFKRWKIKSYLECLNIDVYKRQALFYHKKPIPSDIFACVGIFGGIVCFFIDGLSSGGMFGNFLALCSGLSLIHI